MRGAFKVVSRSLIWLADAVFVFIFNGTVLAAKLVVGLLVLRAVLRLLP